MPLGTIARLLDAHPVETSAPCRIDFGGTLDISSFHYPLRHLEPATVNLALDLRTTVRLKALGDDRVRIASTGVADAAFHPAAAPYDHPLGLMFAVADYFGARGVHIEIHSASPPRSGLGGSSVAAVALIAAFSKVGTRMGREPLTRDRMALLAHAIEQGVAGVPCGMQDHLAAAFGGVNAWLWPADPGRPAFVRRPLLNGDAAGNLARHLLVAYLGVTHISADVNGTWIRQFIGGHHRDVWQAIVTLTRSFADALTRGDVAAAAELMNRETALRKTMTPHVLDDLGDRLAAAAVDAGCGARFTGAGGGGCLWALGTADAVDSLRPLWNHLLSTRPDAALLDCAVAVDGVG